MTKGGNKPYSLDYDAHSIEAEIRLKEIVGEDNEVKQLKADARLPGQVAQELEWWPGTRNLSGHDGGARSSSI